MTLKTKVTFLSVNWWFSMQWWEKKTWNNLISSWRQWLSYPIQYDLISKTKMSKHEHDIKMLKAYLLKKMCCNNTCTYMSGHHFFFFLIGVVENKDWKYYGTILKFINSTIFSKTCITVMTQTNFVLHVFKTVKKVKKKKNHLYANQDCPQASKLSQLA